MPSPFSSTPMFPFCTADGGLVLLGDPPLPPLSLPSFCFDLCPFEFLQAGSGRLDNEMASDILQWGLGCFDGTTYGYLPHPNCGTCNTEFWPACCCLLVVSVLLETGAPSQDLINFCKPTYESSSVIMLRLSPTMLGITPTMLRVSDSPVP